MSKIPRDPTKSTATKRAFIVAPAGPERARIIGMLDGWGIETLASDNPLESAALIYQRITQGEHFDLILFSPDGHGVDAKHYATLIRSDKRVHKTPLVHVGQVDHIGRRGQIRRAGFVDFLSDDGDATDVYDAVYRAMENEEQFRRDHPEVARLADWRPPPKSGEEPIRMLVVTSEMAYKKSARSLACAEGFRLKEASTGEEALRLCTRNDFDVILMGMDLGNTTASDVVSLLRYSMAPERLPHFIGLDMPPAGCEDDFVAVVDPPIRARSMLAAIRQVVTPREASEPPPQTQERIPRLDHRALAELHKLQVNPSPDFVPNLIRSFLEQVEAHIKDLQGVIGKPEGYRRFADFGHDLKDMAGHMGALELWQMGIVAANFPEELFATQSQELLGRIEVAFFHAREDMESYLDVE
jgi:CheY-like chemotaxis protein